MTMALDIVSIGEPLIEFNQTGGAESVQYLQGYGGDSSNFIIAAARQGAKTGYLTALGDDTYGAMFRELWRKEGVDTSAVKIDRAAPTAIYFVRNGQYGTIFIPNCATASQTVPAVSSDNTNSASTTHFHGNFLPSLLSSST